MELVYVLLEFGYLYNLRYNLLPPNLMKNWEEKNNKKVSMWANENGGAVRIDA